VCREAAGEGYKMNIPQEAAVPLTRPACAGHPLPSGEGFRFDDLLSVSEYLRNPQEAEMNARTFSAIVFVATVLISTAVIAQSQPPTRGQAENGSPAWFLQGSFPDPGGNTVVDADGHVTVPARSAAPARPAAPTAAPAPALPRTPGCSRSPLCGNRLTPGRQALQRVEWEQTLGYTFTYPYILPAGAGGVPSVALDSKGNLWVFQRKAAGSPQLYKFDPEYKLILQIGDDVIGHQDKAHGMAVDADDNVWIADTNGATVMKLNPKGELLMTLGERGRRGDWNEAKGHRLLWQPVMIAFGQNGDIYIAEGHADESPNDTDSEDPANTVGAARVIHLDKTGKFISQWYGNSVGQGKFDSVHGLAVDPQTGDVWIGDREQYRIVVYSGDGKFLRTMQMRNLVCALHFDSHGDPWMASGQDGQFLKLDRSGKVIGAIGNGMGIGPGQFIEASYWVFDKQDNLYAGDTSVGRVTKMIAPRK
jgi:NHL repeat